jgi:hypothetical protein
MERLVPCAEDETFLPGAVSGKRSRCWEGGDRFRAGEPENDVKMPSYSHTNKRRLLLKCWQVKGLHLESKIKSK